MYLFVFACHDGLSKKCNHRPNNQHMKIISSQALYWSFHHFFSCHDPLTAPHQRTNIQTSKLMNSSITAMHVEGGLGTWSEFFGKWTSMQNVGKEWVQNAMWWIQTNWGWYQSWLYCRWQLHLWFFWNELVNKKLLASGFCLLHCCIFDMFGDLKDSGHQCKMDYLLTWATLLVLHKICRRR